MHCSHLNLHYSNLGWRIWGNSLPVIGSRFIKDFLESQTACKTVEPGKDEYRLSFGEPASNLEGEQRDLESIVIEDWNQKDGRRRSRARFDLVIETIRTDEATHMAYLNVSPHSKRYSEIIIAGKTHCLDKFLNNAIWPAAGFTDTE